MKTISTHYAKTFSKVFFPKKERIICNVSKDGTVYVTNGYALYLLTPEEYAAYVQPVLHLDAGNWTLEKGEKLEGKISDLSKYWESALKDADTCNPSAEYCKRFPCPYPFKGGMINLYFDPNTRAVHAYNQAFFSVFADGWQLFAPALNKSALISDYDGRPFAFICPIRFSTLSGSAAAARAVIAYFDPIDDPENLASQLTAARTEAAENKALWRDALEKWTDAQKRIDELEKAQAQTPAPAEPNPAERTAEAAAAELAKFPGVTVTIKGAQTSAPVIWLNGDVKPHAAALEKAGCRWSAKRSAYYYRIA